MVTELKDRRKVVLNDTPRFKYTLYASIKEEVDEIIDILSTPNYEKDERLIKYPFIGKNGIHLNMAGDLADVGSQHINDIIPTYVEEHKISGLSMSDRKTIVRGYCCYQNRKATDVVKHEEKLSSFQCACNLLQCKYFFVIKEDKTIIVHLYEAKEEIQPSPLVEFHAKEAIEELTTLNNREDADNSENRNT